MNTENRWARHVNDGLDDKKPLSVRIEERIDHNKKLIADGVASLLSVVGSESADQQRLAFLRALAAEVSLLESIRDNTIE